ncbi:DUF6056 family protein [Isobaculum melis]
MTKLKEKKAVLIMIALFAAMGCLVIMSTDDWFWGGTGGSYLLRHNFFDSSLDSANAIANGRYFGNIIEVFTTKRLIFRVLMYAVFGTSLVVLLKKLVGGSEKLYLAIFFLLILLPKDKIQQVFFWNAGFSNYVPSIVLVLLIFYLFKQYHLFEQKKLTAPLLIGMFVLSFAAQLFLENLTVYNVLLGFFLFIVSFKKSRKFLNYGLIHLLGAISGLVVMFTHPSYQYIFSNNDTYRSVPAGTDSNIIVRMLQTYIDAINDLLLMDNIWLNIILSGLCILLILKAKKHDKFGKGIIVFYAFSIGYFILNKYFAQVVFLGSVKLPLLNFFVSTTWILLLLVIIMRYVDNRKTSGRLSFYLISAFVIAGPFLLITPYPARSFFTSYIFFVLIILELLQEVLRNHQELQQDVTVWARIGTLLFTLITVTALVSMSANRYIYSRNLSHIQAVDQSGGGVVQMDALPFVYYYKDFNPNNNPDLFKDYYKISNELHYIYRAK